MATKPKTISERLKEVQLFTGLEAEELAFVLDKKDSMYKMYLRGRFDDSYSIRQDQLIIDILYLEDSFDEKISLLQNAKKLFRKYIRKKTRPDTRYRRIWIRKRIEFLARELNRQPGRKPREKKVKSTGANSNGMHPKNYGKKSGKLLSAN